MHRTPLHTLLFAAAAAALPLLALAAPESDCRLLSQSEVESQLGSAAVLMSSDEAGSCSWNAGTAGTLVLSLQRRPKASEAQLVFNAFRDSGLAQGQIRHGEPKFGQQAVLLVSAANAPMQTSTVLAQEQTDVLSLALYAQRPPEAPQLAALEALARSAFAQRAKAQQSFGPCEWFTSSQAASLLSDPAPLIQRLGSRHCMASAKAVSASLVAMTGARIEPRALTQMREQRDGDCQVAELPELQAGAFASWACAAPADKALSIEMRAAGRHVQLALNPGSRAATRADLERLLPLARQALDVAERAAQQAKP